MLLVFLIERVAMMAVMRSACYFQTVPQYGCAVCQRGASVCPTLAKGRPTITCCSRYQGGIAGRYKRVERVRWVNQLLRARRLNSPTLIGP